MRILLVAVGRSRNGPERDLYRHYAARLKWPMTLKEVEVKERLPPESLKAREGELLLAALPEDAAVIALDESGALLDSAGFARRLGQWRDRGTGTVAFLIGGADGLSAEVLRRCEWRWSLSRLTFPHALARLLVVEQLYRASSIIAGHPYHRGCRQ